MPLELTVNRAPEGRAVAVPNVTATPFALATVWIDNVAPGLESVTLVSRLPFVSEVSAAVVNDSLTATGWAAVMLIVTVAWFDLAPDVSVATYWNVSVAVSPAFTSLKAPLGL